MGDFSALQLWGALHMDVSVDTPCAGCGKRLLADDRCYGVGQAIWHSRCWPSTAARDAQASPGDPSALRARGGMA